MPHFAKNNPGSYVPRQYRVSFCAALVLCLSNLHVSSAQSVGYLDLPQELFDYVGYAVDDLPAHFGNGDFLSATAADNTPIDNPITNEGATLGRALFYDKRLSHNNSKSCASCHQQDTGFADASRLSTGFDGGRTSRHSPSLANAKFYENGRFFADERAETLEAQILMPIEDPIEMGSDLDQVVEELAATDFYSDMFAAAFGTPDITADRIGKSVSQFVRSMVSYQSKYDSAYDEAGRRNFEETFTDKENLGRTLFHGVGRCSFCHTTEAHIAQQTHNNGLDAVSEDLGAGNGTFKTPSLRNVAERNFFMHDGRFSSLEEVIDFYSEGIQDNPDLDFRLRDTENDDRPVQLQFTTEEKEALIAFLGTLTDDAFLTDPMFSDPFVVPCDLDGNEVCNVRDINALLAASAEFHGIEVTPEIAVFDLNGDSYVDNNDATQWLEMAADANGVDEYVPGDGNLDGKVDGTDHDLLARNFLGMSTDWDDGDWNGDGFVDGSDFNIWVTARQSADEPLNNVVPEPAGQLALLIAIACSIGLRRRR